MVDLIQSGILLVKDGTAAPESVVFERQPCLKGWSIVLGLPASGLERKLSQVGWTLFYLAAEINSSAWGRNEAQAALKAVRRLLTRKDARKFNCLQITEVRSKRWLGITRVHLVAHWRHIQKGPVLFQPGSSNTSGAAP